MKHRFNLISCKLMVVLTLKLGLYPSKTAAIYRSVFTWTATSGKAPPRGPTVLHPWFQEKRYWNIQISGGGTTTRF